MVKPWAHVAACGRLGWRGLGETLRVVELRETLKSIDMDFNRRMALIEFLLFRNKITITELLKRPQVRARTPLRAVQ